MKNWLRIAAFLAIPTSAFGQQSFTIDQAWQYAVENNVNVKKAKIDQTIAQQKVKETTGIGLPQINAQGGYTYYLKIPVQLLPAEIMGGPAGTYVPVQFGQKQNANAGLSLSQLLFNGSYLVGLQSAKAYRETANLVEEKSEISIKQAILLSYTGIIVTDESLKTIEENRKIVEKTLFEVRETYKAGLAEFQSVEQQEYAYKSLTTTQENFKRNRTQLVMALKYLMGYPMDQDLTLVSTFDELVQKNETLPATDRNFDVTHHIDYRIQQNALRLNQLNLKYQKSKYLPTLSGFINSAYNGFSNDFTFFDRSQRWFNTSTTGLQLNVPIFSGFQRKWQTEQAKLVVKKSELDLEDMERSLKNKLFKAYTDYENSYNSYVSAKDLVGLSNSIYKKQQIKFAEGMGSSLELQQAETQLYDSQSKLYNAALNLMQAKTNLDEALGKL